MKQESQIPQRKLVRTRIALSYGAKGISTCWTV